MTKDVKHLLKYFKKPSELPRVNYVLIPAGEV